jgi:hypothetical protein
VPRTDIEPTVILEEESPPLEQDSWIVIIFVITLVAIGITSASTLIGCGDKSYGRCGHSGRSQGTGDNTTKESGNGDDVAISISNKNIDRGIETRPDYVFVYRIRSIITAALPQILQKPAGRGNNCISFAAKCVVELKMHHKFCSVVFRSFSCEYGRGVKMLSMWTYVLTVLAIDTVLLEHLSIAHDDNGTCEEYTTPTNCHGHGGDNPVERSYCAWSDDDGVGVCHYRDPRGDSDHIVIIFFLCAMVGTGWASSVDSFIVNTLSIGGEIL